MAGVATIMALDGHCRHVRYCFPALPLLFAGTGSAADLLLRRLWSSDASRMSLALSGVIIAFGLVPSVAGIKYFNAAAWKLANQQPPFLHSCFDWRQDAHAGLELARNLAKRQGMLGGTIGVFDHHLRLLSPEDQDWRLLSISQSCAEPPDFLIIDRTNHLMPENKALSRLLSIYGETTKNGLATVVLGRTGVYLLSELQGGCLLRCLNPPKKDHTIMSSRIAACFAVAAMFVAMEAARPDAITDLSVESQSQIYGGAVCVVEGTANCPDVEGATTCKDEGGACTGNLLNLKCPKKADGTVPTSIHKGGDYPHIGFSNTE